MCWFALHFICVKKKNSFGRKKNYYNLGKVGKYSRICSEEQSLSSFSPLKKRVKKKCSYGTDSAKVFEMPFCVAKSLGTTFLFGRWKRQLFFSPHNSFMFEIRMCLSVFVFVCESEMKIISYVKSNF